MKRPLRFAAVFLAAMAILPFLPLYIHRRMVRLQMESGGDIIRWGWDLVSLSTYWSDYTYIRREQEPAFWLAVNIGLTFLYALVIAIVIDKVLARLKRRKEHAGREGRAR